MTISQLYSACCNDDEAAMEILIVRFHPLMMKVSLRYGYFDQDCYQECALAMIKSVKKFSIR
ncbi:hypothetical protein QuyetLC_24480 [Bacillus anthracis]|uniref:Helix-turn-helix conjugative transposon-like domain-containing protein n=1 Tax=Bacillus anthracis TaxID=1392 RepID=A0A640MHC1_BACAN|nr:hypothetical protein QuyetLC_24480 [Bacillus anthracis]